MGIQKHFKPPECKSVDWPGGAENKRINLNQSNFSYNMNHKTGPSRLSGTVGHSMFKSVKHPCQVIMEDFYDVLDAPISFDSLHYI